MTSLQCLVYFLPMNNSEYKPLNFCLWKHLLLLIGISFFCIIRSNRPDQDLRYGFAYAGSHFKIEAWEQSGAKSIPLKLRQNRQRWTPWTSTYVLFIRGTIIRKLKSGFR